MAPSAASAAWPVPAGQPAIALLLAGGTRRRIALRRWAAHNVVGDALWTDDAGLTARLEALPGQTIVVPVGARTAPRSAPLITVGDSATIDELRERRSARGQAALGDFVRQQATLAVDRAERRRLGDAYKTPRGVTEEITSSARFAETVSRLSAQVGQPPAEVAREARECLDEMSAQHSRWAIDVWKRIGGWMARAYSIDADESRIPELKDLNRRHALVFLPNHRSYLDPVVLRAVLARGDFPPNHVLGGINLSFWPMGPFARRTGIVFIRRQFKDAPVYKAMLGEYLAYLLAKRFNLEWYIEGGRTRSGKLRPPRFGILSYLVDAFDDAGVDDVYIVPVAIVYDQQHEVGAISAEESGGSKKAESVGWLVDFARAQSRRLGRVHVRFGDPMSLRAELEEAKQSSGSDDPRVGVPRVAFEICNRINGITPITPSALVTFALLGNDGRAITVAEGQAILDPLLDYVRARHLPVTPGIDFAEDGQLAEALATLVREGVATRFEGGTDPLFDIADDRLHEAAFYRNTMIHFLVTRAIMEVALVRAAEEHASDVGSAVWEEALRLRDLLKFEFFFSRKRDFARDLMAEVELARSDWATVGSEDTLATLDATGLFTAHRVVGPFLEGYAIMAELLAEEHPSQPLDEPQFVARCIAVARQRWRQRRMVSPEAISKDLYSSGLNLARNRELLGIGGAELTARRLEFADELAQAVRRVDVIRRMAQSRI